MINRPIIVVSFITLILRTLIAISRSSWLILWAAIELNLLRFIPFLLKNKNTQNSEAVTKYFLAQAIGSAILLYSRFNLWYFTNQYSHNLLIIAILLKLGRFPCHFWFPRVIIASSWFSCLILSTWQKLAPLSILAFSLIQENNYFIYFIAIINAIIGGTLGINQTHLRSIIAYSSIRHIGWIISILTYKYSTICIIYYTIYVLLISPIFLLFHLISSNNIKSVNKILNIPPIIQISLALILFSLAGLPPLTGFIPKLIVLFNLFNLRAFLAFILIIGSIITLYFYLNICLSLLIINNNNLIKKRSAGKSILLLSRILRLFLFPLFLFYALTIFH